MKACCCSSSRRRLRRRHLFHGAFGGWDVPKVEEHPGSISQPESGLLWKVGCKCPPHRVALGGPSSQRSPLSSLKPFRAPPPTHCLLRARDACDFVTLFS